VTAIEFLQRVWRQKTSLPRLPCGIVCAMIYLAILIEHWRTDGQTD